MKSRSGPVASNVTLLPTEKSASSSRPDWLKPQIPPGMYTVAYDTFHTENFYKGGKTPKLVLSFHVIDMGEYFETPLKRYYQVAQLGKRPEEGGWFKAKGQSSHFIMEYAACFHRVPKRLDRVPMEMWKRHGYKVRVKDVFETANQDTLPQILRYSVIDKIIRVAE